LVWVCGSELNLQWGYLGAFQSKPPRWPLTLRRTIAGHYRRWCDAMRRSRTASARRPSVT